MNTLYKIFDGNQQNDPFFRKYEVVSASSAKEAITQSEKLRYSFVGGKVEDHILDNIGRYIATEYKKMTKEQALQIGIWEEECSRFRVRNTIVYLYAIETTQKEIDEESQAWALEDQKEIEEIWADQEEYDKEK